MLILSGGLLIIFLFILFIVRRGTHLTAREALLNYLQAVRGGRTEEAYGYLAAASRSGQTLAAYKSANSLGNGLIAGILGRHISFVVEKVEETQDRATAVVAVTAPDFKLMLLDIFHEFAPERIPGPSLPAMIFLCRRISYLLDRYHGDDIPLTTTTETFRLLREDDGWKIDIFPAGENNETPSHPS